VAVKVDEARLVTNQSFANALATLGSAALEGGPRLAVRRADAGPEDPLRPDAGLLRQRCMLSMDESAGAREMGEIVMNVYTDMVKDDSASRSRERMTPGVIYNLPTHHALCSWISSSAGQPRFTVQTMPLETDGAVVEHHLTAQRARGAFAPDRLPDPLPEVASTAPWILSTARSPWARSRASPSTRRRRASWSPSS
jgi:hypothetical protein